MPVGSWLDAGRAPVEANAVNPVACRSGAGRVPVGCRLGAYRSYIL